MLDAELLSKTIVKSGLKKNYIAQRLGLSTYGLQKKINSESEFKASEIKQISILLNLSNELREKIFFK